MLCSADAAAVDECEALLGFTRFERQPSIYEAEDAKAYFQAYWTQCRTVRTTRFWGEPKFNEMWCNQERIQAPPQEPPKPKPKKEEPPKKEPSDDLKEYLQTMEIHRNTKKWMEDNGIEN